MGKTGKWLKSFLTGKKDKDKDKEKEKEKDEKNNNNNNGSIKQPTSTASQNPTTPVTITRNKDKKRWSFRRSSATSDNAFPSTQIVSSLPLHDKLVQDVAADTNNAVPTATLMVNEAVDALLPNQDAAAVKIQSVFRSFLARKALKALRGLVKLQALVRGHLVRKQATETLRCMKALMTAQARARARARAQRIRSVDEGNTRNSQEKIKHDIYDVEENIKIVEMDKGEFKSNINIRNINSSPIQQHMSDRMDNRMSTYYSSQSPYTKADYSQYSPIPSAITDMSPRTCSSHFEDYSFATAQNSPLCYSAESQPDPSRIPFSFPRPEYAEKMSYDFPLYPNYMANTESSRAKVRSQSAPKQRPPEFERQPSRGRRPSVEGRNIPKGAKMQRSSSHVGSTAQNYQYPWSIKLDKSTISLKDSECGSTCSVATNAYYCRSVVSYDVKKEFMDTSRPGLFPYDT